MTSTSSTPPSPPYTDPYLKRRLTLKQWENRPRTLRHPDSRGTSRNALIEQELDNESASLRQEVSLLLLSYTDFDDFSNSTWRRGTATRPLTSLESVHDDIHGRTGGSGGHMSSLDVSAMDPIFWLHHCAVDRLWAIWGALNPDEFMGARPAPYSNFTVRSGTLEDARTPLSPFWDSSGSRFWTSEGVRSTAVFGYAYPETRSWAFKGKEEYQRELRRTVARLYGSNPFLDFAQTVAPKDAAAGRPSFQGLAAGARLAAVSTEEQKPIVAAEHKVKSAVRSLAAGIGLAAAAPKEEQKPVTTEKHKDKPAEGSKANKISENPIEEGDITGKSLPSSPLQPPTNTPQPPSQTPSSASPQTTNTQTGSSTSAP